MGIGIVLPSKKQYGDKILSQDWNTFIDNFKIIDEFLQNIVTRNIVVGKIQNIDTSKAGLVYGQVTFSKPFNKVPVVLLSFDSLDQRVRVGNLTTQNVNENGFVWQFRVLVSVKDTYCNLFYVAIEQL